MALLGNGIGDQELVQKILRRNKNNTWGLLLDLLLVTLGPRVRRGDNGQAGSIQNHVDLSFEFVPHENAYVLKLLLGIFLLLSNSQSTHTLTD